MLRQEDGSFKELNWEEAFDIAKTEFSKVEGDQISAIIGNFVDIESACALRDLIHRQGSENLEVRSDAPKLDADFRS
jgi:NADH-quinone oxidoreductase subunit G